MKVEFAKSIIQCLGSLDFCFGFGRKQTVITSLILNLSYMYCISRLTENINTSKVFKDSAYYCYCAYVLRIARYSGFLWVVPTNTGIFLRGLKLYGESRT